MADKQDAVQRRLAGGTLAPVKVLTCTQLAVNTNQQAPFVTLLLEVQPEYGQPFTAQVNGTPVVPQVDKYAPGSIVYVHYDPANTSEVALVGSERPV